MQASFFSLDLKKGKNCVPWALNGDAVQVMGNLILSQYVLGFVLMDTMQNGVLQKVVLAWKGQGSLSLPTTFPRYLLCLFCFFLILFFLTASGYDPSYRCSAACCPRSRFWTFEIWELVTCCVQLFVIKGSLKNSEQTFVYTFSWEQFIFAKHDFSVSLIFLNF